MEIIATFIVILDKKYGKVNRPIVFGEGLKRGLVAAIPPRTAEWVSATAEATMLNFYHLELADELT